MASPVILVAIVITGVADMDQIGMMTGGCAGIGDPVQDQGPATGDVTEDPEADPDRVQDLVDAATAPDPDPAIDVVVIDQDRKINQIVSGQDHDQNRDVSLIQSRDRQEMEMLQWIPKPVR